MVVARGAMVDGREALARRARTLAFLHLVLIACPQALRAQNPSPAGPLPPIQAAAWAPGRPHRLRHPEPALEPQVLQGAARAASPLCPRTCMQVAPSPVSIALPKEPLPRDVRRFDVGYAVRDCQRSALAGAPGPAVLRQAQNRIWNAAGAIEGRPHASDGASAVDNGPAAAPAVQAKRWVDGPAHGAAEAREGKRGQGGSIGFSLENTHLPRETTNQDRDQRSDEDSVHRKQPARQGNGQVDQGAAREEFR